MIKKTTLKNAKWENKKELKPILEWVAWKKILAHSMNRFLKEVIRFN